MRQPALRRLVGLPVGAPQPVAGAPPLRPAPASAAAAAAAVASGAAGPLPSGVDPELRQFLLTTSDQMALFEKAAALRAEGRAGATSTVLQRLLQLYPGQPNALYALGQVRRGGGAVGCRAVAAAQVGVVAVGGVAWPAAGGRGSCALPGQQHGQGRTNPPLCGSSVREQVGPLAD